MTNPLDFEQEFERGAQDLEQRSLDEGKRAAEHRDEMDKLFRMIRDSEFFHRHGVSVYRTRLFRWESGAPKIVLAKERKFWSGKGGYVVIDHCASIFSYGTPIYEYSPSETGYYSTGFLWKGSVEYKLGDSAEAAAKQLAYELGAGSLRWAQPSDFFDPTVKSDCSATLPKPGLTFEDLTVYGFWVLVVAGGLAVLRFLFG